MQACVKDNRAGVRRVRLPPLLLFLLVLLSGITTCSCDDVTAPAVDENNKNIDSGGRRQVGSRGGHRRHMTHARRESGSIVTSLRHADAAAMHLKDMRDFVVEDVRTLDNDDVMADAPLHRRLRNLAGNDVITPHAAKPTRASVDDDAQINLEMLEYRPQHADDLETTTEGHVKVTTIEEGSIDDPDYLKDMVRILRNQLEESQNTQRITR